MNIRLRALALVLVAALGLAACGQAPEETKEPTKEPAQEATEEPQATEEAPADEATETAQDDAADKADAGDNQFPDYKGCIVSDAGGWDDQSFNQSAHEGLQAATKEYGIQHATAESSTEADFAPNVDNMVQEGCNLITGVGFLLEQPIEDAAKANPDIHFALVDSLFTDNEFNPITIDNARPLLFNTAEASYLAGYVAASLTESKKIGTFGGMSIPSVNIFMDGFEDGIKRWNADNNDEVQLIGWSKEKQEGSFAGNFDDIGQGQTITEGLIAQGADIIFPVAGPLGNGAAAAARAKGGISLVWVDSDGYLTAPDHKDMILTSVVKNISGSIQESILLGAQGKFTSESYIGTLENGGVGLSPFHDFDDKVSAEVKEALEKLKQEIIDGTTVVETPNAPH